MASKCLKMLIRHHGVDVKRRKSIWTLVVGGCSSAFSTRHGELSRVKKYLFLKKNNSSFLMTKTHNNFKT
jgi:hypothetical protein